MSAAVPMQIQDDRLFLDGALRYVKQALDGELERDHDGLVLIGDRLCSIEVDSAAQSKLIHDLCGLFYTDGKPERGMTLAEKACRFALLHDDTKAFIRALTLLGIFAGDTGNLPQAMECYAEALALSQGIDDRLLEGKIWQNLATALIYSGLFSEAIVCLKRGLRLAETTPELKVYVSGMLANLALSHLNLGQTEQGLQAIRQAHERTVETGFKPLNTLREVLIATYHTRLLLEAKQFSQACHQAQLAQQFADKANTERAQINASIAVGLADVFTGNGDAGILRLTDALAQAIKLKVVTREVFFALVKAHEYLDQHDHALDYLKKLLDAQRNTQRANVLQHVKRHLAQLKSVDSDVAVEETMGTLEKIEQRLSVIEGRVAQADLNKRDQERFVAQIEVMERLAIAAELRDDDSGLHAYRVGRLAQLLAREAGCSPSDVFMIDIAARLHDIGKVGIPDAILLKISALNKSEREVVKTHAALGADLLAQSGIPHIEMAVDVATSHHEWWNGTGYPHGLKGDAIPLSARITAISEVFDTLTHPRSYKEAWPLEKALAEILALRETQFDPLLTDKFMALMTRLSSEQVNLETYLSAGAAQSRFLQSRQQIRDRLA